MTGCAQKALDTDINDATIRLLTRLGCEVVIPEGQGCCGALTHHMGKTAESHGAAGANIRAWAAEMDGAGLDAIVINTSGCGTTVKDYGHMFEGTELEADAKRVAALARDVSEVLRDLELPAGGAPDMTVAYHAACSLQHGQQIKSAPKDLLKRAGFTVVEPKDSHLCCGSAGTYNGNIGCMMQIGSAAGVPVVHTVELLDWATGGPRPAKFDRPHNRAAKHAPEIPILR